MKQRILSLALALCLCLSPAIPAAEAADTRAEALRSLGILSGETTGSQVTRARFAQMLTSASAYKDSAEGYGTSLFKDLKGDHWASGYVRVAIEQGWMTGYVDGTFRPDQAITLEEACAAALKVLGYDASTLKGAYPAAQISKAGSLGLLDGVSASRGSPLTDTDCAIVLYGLLTAKTSGGTVYGTTLGYTVTNGQVDYASLVSAGTKGPYVAESAALSLPFTPSAVYYNGTASSLDRAQAYDVYYYNEAMNTVWICHDRVTGTLTAVSPSAAAPASVTVAGVSYEIGDTQAAYQLSSQGSFQEGDTVSLLLGMDGSVIGVIDAAENDAVYYGSVVSSEKNPSLDAANGSAQITTQVACTDGVVRSFYHRGTPLSAGKLVSVTTVSTGTRVSGLSSKSLTGTVSRDGTSIGDRKLAGDVEILDTDTGGGYARIYPSRLAGAKLSGGDVYSYTLNAGGEIDRMILRDVTGDTRDYVYVTNIEDNSSGRDFSVNYTYLQNGETRTLNNAAKYALQCGGAMLNYEGGSLKSIRQLRSVTLDSLSSLSATGGGRSYKLAEDVQVLLRDTSGGDGWYLADLDQVDGGDYKLTGWYDDLGCSAGGRIRIVTALAK